MTDGTTKRRGRPPKPLRAQGNLTFRTPIGLREQLSHAAAAADRSVSEEVTYRLQQSLENESAIFGVLGGPDGADLVKGLASVVSIVQGLTGHSHRTDRRTAGEVSAGLARFLDIYFGAENFPVEHPGTLEEVSRAPGRFAAEVAAKVAGLKSSSEARVLLNELSGGVEARAGSMPGSNKTARKKTASK